ncbi:hypothetical protein [Shimia sp. FJ5]|uniref:hypothetical protein n=1 Tax=Shimia sp. FJ5 TaxID=3079054 RepID=UPI00261FE1BE|nr:hypothetical protein [Shimia sp. FJ5]MDV4144718.1 hypothetical protein [Shimia sp. FJ5]
MVDWVKSLFGKRKTEISSTDTVEDDELLKQFKVVLANRMDEFYPEVRDAFATLLDADLPDSIKGLHIEVFLDDPAFSFRLFSKGKNDVWSDDPEAVEKFNDTINRIWPIVTEDELDQYTIWEDDPKWGRQVALEQPLDKLNVPRIVFPWFKKIVSETRGDFSHPITASVHDITLPEEL